MYWRFHFWEFEFSFLVFKKTVGVAVQWAVFSRPFYASLLHITRIMNTLLHITRNMNTTLLGYMLSVDVSTRGNWFSDHGVNEPSIVTHAILQ